MSQPAFIFVGPSKSGSTWLYEVLREHPQVFVPPAKDIYYFDRYFERGHEWYEAFFGEAGEGQVAGEVCHDYLSNPEALQRIAAYRPDLKIICCLRNPYERAVSSYQFYHRNGLGLPTLAEQAEQHPSLISEGFYATHLRSVFRCFPKDQVLVLRFEDIQDAPADLVRALFRFLGVDPEFQPACLHEKVNPASAARSPLLAKLVKRGADLARAMGLSNLVGSIKRNRLVTRLLYRKIGEQGFSGDARFPDWAVADYEREILELQDLTGLSFAPWSRSAAEGRHLRQ